MIGLATALGIHAFKDKLFKKQIYLVSHYERLHNAESIPTIYVHIYVCILGCICSWRLLPNSSILYINYNTSHFKS